MKLSGGWVPIRRGLLQHLHDGKLTPSEFMALTLMILLADSDTGVWTGCADGLVFVAGGQLNVKTTKDAFRSLEKKGYIRRNRTQGQRGIYPVLLDKYLATTGNLKGKRLNLAATTDCAQPAYENVPDAVSDKEPDKVCDEERDKEPYTTNQQSKKPRKDVSQSGSSPSSGVQCKVKPAVDGVAEAQTLAQLMCVEVLQLSEPFNPKAFASMTEDACNALDSLPIDKLKGLLNFAKNHPWWAQKLAEVDRPMAFFAKSLDSLEQQSERANRPKPKASLKPQPEKNPSSRSGVAECMKFFKKDTKK